ncbi:MAG: hypothetical protein LBB16_02615 [Puniceicoccales bacterium]|jgi:hypothetical protein|nr:hypothetical protein [Puniceicoccales bacterium]
MIKKQITRLKELQWRSVVDEFYAKVDVDAILRNAKLMGDKDALLKELEELLSLKS